MALVGLRLMYDDPIFIVTVTQEEILIIPILQKGKQKLRKESELVSKKVTGRMWRKLSQSQYSEPDLLPPRDE